MAYASWSVTFGEQPSAAKWNILGTNDASFNDGTGIADDAIKSRHIDWADTGGGDTGGIWWEELGRTTLGSTADIITVDSLPARKYLKIHSYTINSNSIQQILRFNNDSGNNYAYRVSTDGAADGTAATQSAVQVSTATSAKVYAEIQVVNQAAVVKPVRFFSIRYSTGTPGRGEGAGLWENSSDAISRVDIVQNSTGDFASGSEVVVLGHN